MRRRRLIRYLFVALVLLAGLFVAADVVSLQVAESRAAAQIARTTGAERVQVDLGSFPFLPSLWRGRLDQVTVDGYRLSGGGLRVERLEGRASDVTFDRSKIIALIRSRYADRAKVVGGGAIGRIDITQEDLAEFLKNREPRVRGVRVTRAGVEVEFEPVAGVELPKARFLPVMVDGRLVLNLTGAGEIPRPLQDGARRLERLIDLPPVPPGLRADARLSLGVIQVEASGPRVQMEIGEGGIQ
ncbi:MAG TPA: DUF2993 domain-containing protein [Actinomycetota bacterium]|nr:DUF2993 domain-containing protein [Actinomycetota bacterium]